MSYARREPGTNVRFKHLFRADDKQTSIAMKWRPEPWCCLQYWNFTPEFAAEKGIEVACICPAGYNCRRGYPTLLPEQVESITQEGRRQGITDEEIWKCRLEFVDEAGALRGMERHNGDRVSMENAAARQRRVPPLPLTLRHRTVRLMVPSTQGKSKELGKKLQGVKLARVLNIGQGQGNGGAR